jgi:sugar phosphate isomerase/epimerase
MLSRASCLLSPYRTFLERHFRFLTWDREAAFREMTWVFPNRLFKREHIFEGRPFSSATALWGDFAMLLSVNQVTTLQWDFERDVELYSAAEIPAIGVWRQKTTDYGADHVAALLAKSGIVVSHLAWAGGFTGYTNVAGGRKNTLKDAVRDAERAIRTAAAINAPTLLLNSGERGHYTPKHARRLCIEAMKRLAPLAQEEGVLLGMEPCHPACCKDTTWMTDVDHVRDMRQCVIDATGCDVVRLVLDVYHLGETPDLIDRIPEFLDDLCLVQLADRQGEAEYEQNRCMPFRGRLPIREIVSALDKAGYDGFLDMELYGDDMESIDYVDRLFECRELFDRLTGAGAASPK